MNKKNIVNCLLAFNTFWLIVLSVYFINSLQSKHLLFLESLKAAGWIEESGYTFKMWAEATNFVSFVVKMLFVVTQIIFNILFLCISILKGSNISRKVKEHKEKKSKKRQATAEERKEKKKAKLEKQLAELEEMKNE